VAPPPRPPDDSNGAGQELATSRLHARSTVPPIAIPEPEARSSLGSQILISLLTSALGFAAGYLVFGTDLIRKKEVAAPVATVPEPAAPEPAAPEPVAPEPVAPEPVAPEPAVVEDQTCTVTIEPTPPTARALLDGKEVGVGELADLAVPCGRELKLVVEHAGYRTFEKSFTASPELPLRIDASLARLPAAPKRSRLRVVTDPAGAILTVDGKVVGRTPTTVTVTTAETVFLTATLKGYKGWTKRVTVKKKKQTVSANLDAIGEP
jgi:hypothetical protein